MNKDSSIYKMILLGVLCGICGLLLAAVNSLTAPVIAENQLSTVLVNLEQIFPDAEFEDVSDDYLSEDTTGLIEAVYIADGEGVVFTVSGTGYSSSGFTFMVGFDNDGNIAGFMALEQSETSGIGSEVFADDFASTYIGVGTDAEIPMLSGATLTSSGVKTGIEAAQALLEVING